MKIYHNPRCRKSREGIQYLTDKKLDFEIFDYLKEGISENNIKSILKKLNISAIELVRKNEKIWKDNFKGEKLKETEIISILSEEPKLIERPIIVYNNKAVIGRPKENIDKLL
ncbi:MAG: arsenate reductase (glutaredoxin) [Flavobacteriaceae bacterium]|nr:arsenate reductase (glutaredoxin) [Flavobacteriaceae bacterium]